MATLRNAIYEQAQSGEHAHTVRGIFYKLASFLKLIPKTKTEYKQTVIRLCGEMREDGTLPRDWIRDETRWMRRPKSYTSIQAAVDACQKLYRRDALAECSDYLEIWCEKNTSMFPLVAEMRPR